MSDSFYGRAYYAPSYLYDPIVDNRGQWATQRLYQAQEYSITHHPMEYDTKVDVMALKYWLNITVGKKQDEWIIQIGK